MTADLIISIDLTNIKDKLTVNSYVYKKWEDAQNIRPGRSFVSQLFYATQNCSLHFLVQTYYN